MKESGHTAIVSCREDGQKKESGPGIQDDTRMVPFFSHPLIISSSSNCLSLTPGHGSWQKALDRLTQASCTKRAISCDLMGKRCDTGTGDSVL